MLNYETCTFFVYKLFLTFFLHNIMLLTFSIEFLSYYLLCEICLVGRNMSSMILNSENIEHFKCDRLFQYNFQIEVTIHI